MRRLSWFIFLLATAATAASWAGAQSGLDQESEADLRTRLTELQPENTEPRGSIQHASNALDASRTLDGEARLRALTIAAAALALAEQERFRDETLSAITASQETLTRAESRLLLAQERLSIAQDAVNRLESNDP